MGYMWTLWTLALVTHRFDGWCRGYCSGDRSRCVPGTVFLMGIMVVVRLACRLDGLVVSDSRDIICLRLDYCFDTWGFVLMKSFRDACYSAFNGEQVKAWDRDHKILDGDRLIKKQNKIPIEKNALYLPVVILWYVLFLLGVFGFLLCNIPLLVFSMLGVFLYPFSLGLIVMLICKGLIVRNARKWEQDGYAGSEWYRGLDDDEKAHVRAWFESEPYRLLDRELLQLTRVSHDDCMKEAVSILDNAIETADEIREGISRTNYAYILHGSNSTVEMYRKYRAAFSSSLRNTRLPLFVSGTTGLTHKHEEILGYAVGRYNEQVDEVNQNRRLIDILESSMAEIRTAVNATPHDNSMGNASETHWARTNAVVAKIEEVAYNGFDNE